MPAGGLVARISASWGRRSQGRSTRAALTTVRRAVEDAANVVIQPPKYPRHPAAGTQARRRIGCAHFGELGAALALEIANVGGESTGRVASVPMAEVHALPVQRREFITDGGRSELRATWHNDSGLVVISLWHGETCVATSHLTPDEAARLSGFITGGLAELANENVRRKVVPMRPRDQTSFRRSFDAWRATLAASLASLARRLR